jgi:hypothetical protein
VPVHRFHLEVAAAVNGAVLAIGARPDLLDRGRQFRAQRVFIAVAIDPRAAMKIGLV